MRQLEIRLSYVRSKKLAQALAHSVQANFVYMPNEAIIYPYSTVGTLFLFFK